MIVHLLPIVVEKITCPSVKLFVKHQNYVVQTLNVVQSTTVLSVPVLMDMRVIQIILMLDVN